MLLVHTAAVGARLRCVSSWMIESNGRVCRLQNQHKMQDDVPPSPWAISVPLVDTIDRYAATAAAASSIGVISPLAVGDVPGRCPALSLWETQQNRALIII